MSSTIQSRKDEAASFLNALFGTVDNEFILLWTLPDKKSYWSYDELLEKVADIATSDDYLKKDVYIGCGTSSKDYGKNKRCPAKKISGIPGLWIDIDIKGPNHKKTNLPGKLADGLALLDEAPIYPTIVAITGGGIQAWWLFNEFFYTKSEEDRKKAEELTKGWNQLFKVLASNKGWDIDSTADLSRVFRLPGTNNNKGNSSKRIRIKRFNNDRRYNPSDIEEFLSEAIKPIQQFEKPEPAEPAEPAETPTTKIVVRADAQPPARKLMALFANVPEVVQTYDRKRKDLQDQSPSSYDFAMTNFCIQAGWTDQEITNILIAARRDNKEDLKLRVDYYQRTIQKIRADYKGIKEVIKKEEAVITAIEKIDNGNGEEDVDVISVINDILGTEIEDIKLLLLDPPVCKLILTNGKKGELTTSQYMGRNQFSNRYVEIAQKRVKTVKPAIWDKIVTLIVNYIGKEENQIEILDSTEIELITDFIAQYFDNVNIQETIDEDIVRQNLPWQNDDYIFIRITGLVSWVRANIDPKMNSKSLSKFLIELGYEQTTVKVPNKNTTRSYWRIKK